MTQLLFNGIHIFENWAIPEFKESGRRERKWARRVKFERFRRFDYTYERAVVKFGDKFFAHPNTLRVMMESIK